MSSGGGFSGGGGGYSGGFGPPMGGFGGGFGPPMGGFGQQFGGFQPPQYGGGFGQPFGGGFQQPQYGGGFGFQQPQFGGFQNQGPGNAYARQNPYQPPPGMEVNPNYQPSNRLSQDMRLGDRFSIEGGPRNFDLDTVRRLSENPPLGFAERLGGSPQGARPNPATGILPSEPLSDPNAGKVKNPYYYDRFANGAVGTADVKFSDREYVSPEELNRFGTATSDMGMYDSMIRPAVTPSYGSPYGGFGAPYGGSPYMGMLGGLGGFFGGNGFQGMNQQAQAQARAQQMALQNQNMGMLQGGGLNEIQSRSALLQSLGAPQYDAQQFNLTQ